MPFYDITHPLTETLAPWPGDTPLTRAWNLRLGRGDSVNLSDVRLSVHLGTHADAPCHYDDGGETVEALDPARYVGPCLVADVTGRDPVTAADLEGLDLADTPRLLLRTGGWPDPARFPERIPVLSPDAIDLLAARGVRLLGLDVPSVDPLDSKALPNHHALGRRGILILESLALDGVPPGYYELIALPLKLVGADGSPVRAVLRALPRRPARSRPMPEPWPFPNPEDLDVITTRHWTEERRPVLYVFHDDEEDWSFLPVADPDEADARVTELRDLVTQDPTLRELADLPPGWCAWRENKGDAWQRAPLEDAE